MKKLKKITGFTLIELLAAIVILGIIIAMALPQISTLVDDNTNAKYKTYAETIKTSAKLYTDAYNEDMFGNNESGCYDIKFNQMLEKKLIQDIKLNDATCAGGTEQKTFVRVHKSKNHYEYKLSILCTDKDDSSIVLYEESISDDLEGYSTFCDGKTIDDEGPIISLSKNGSSWTTGIGMKTKIIIEDEFGLLENAEIKYTWTTNPNTLHDAAWIIKNFRNERYAKQATTEVALPQNKNTNYYLVVQPLRVRDSNGNYQTNTLVSNAFQLDNTLPKCEIEVAGVYGNNNWFITKPKISLEYQDTHGVVAKYGMSISTNITYNSQTTAEQNDTKKITWYGYVEDRAGNVGRCQTSELKVDTTPPTKPTTGKISLSGTNSNATLPSATGATDITSGVAQYQYIVKNNSTIPTDTSSFTSSTAYTRSCGTTYYAFSIAVDNAGNKSEIYSMGNATDGVNKYSAWSKCTKSCGTGTQTRTNTCALITTNLKQNCNTQSCCTPSTTYGSWSSCSCYAGNCTQSRSVTKVTCPNGQTSTSYDTEYISCDAPAHTHDWNARGSTCHYTGAWSCSCGRTHTCAYYRRCAICGTRKTFSPTYDCADSPHGPTLGGWVIVPD